MKVLSTHSFTWLVLLLFLGYGCAVSEEMTEEPQQIDAEIPEPAAESVSPIPDWYHSAVSSDADSVSLYGYAYTVSADLDDAVDQAGATAEKYLRFEVDRQLERVRTDLEADGYVPAGEQEFIIRLRNIAESISLGQSPDIDMEHILHDENRNEIYVRYVLTRSALYSELENHLSDQKFLEKVRESG